MTRLWPLFLLLTACGPALTALDPGVDAARLNDRLAGHAPDSAGYVESTWLCLLHGRGCDRLSTPPPNPAAAAVPLEAQWARALASDALGPIAPRLDAWLALADAATGAVTRQDPRGDRLLTVAVEAIGRLALRDDALVTARLVGRGAEALRWLALGSTAERWRRQRVLARWQIADTASAPLPLVVTLAPEPLSRRLFTGLDNVPAALPPPTRTLPLPPPAVLGEPYALPARDAGVYQLRVEFAIGERQNLLLRVAAPRPLRVWCDGQPLARIEPGDDAQETWLDLPAGAHHLDIAVPIGHNGQPLALALLPGTKVVASASAAPTWHATLDDVLTALREPESDAVARLGQQFPQQLLHAEAALQRADLRDTDALPSAGAVDALLAHWPGHFDGQLARVVHTREAGQAQLAWQSLQALRDPPRPVDSADPVVMPAQRADVQLEAAMTYQALGLADLAAAAAESAVQLQPRDCRTLARAFAIGQDTLNRPLIRRLLDLPLACPADRLSRAFAESMVGRLDAALASLLVAQRLPATAREASGLAALMAQTLHLPQPARPPWGENPQDDIWLAAQAAELRHDVPAAQAALQRLLTAPGLPLEARQKAIQAGAQPIWQPFVKDGEAVAQTEVTDAFASGSATVWLLDQEIVQLLPDGGALRRVHQVVRVREDAAADAVGEVRVGDGADLELARTILADGSLVLPAETADKETISLRAVAAGTSVEFSQIAYVQADDPATGATRLPLFHMQSSDAPVLRSEYIVLVPQGLTVRLDASPAAGAPEIKQLGTHTAYVFTRDNLARVRNEPRAVRPERVLPTVRALVRPGLAAVLEPWNEALAAYVRSRDVTLRAWSATLAQAPESLARWQMLAAKLALHVQHAHEGGPPGRPETALSEGKGDRAATFYALARQAGADACLVRVLPLARLPGADPLAVNAPLDPDDYGLELVRLRVPLPGATTATEIWYDPAQEGGHLNHLRAGLRGRDGLLCGCATPPVDPRVTVPALGEGEDHRAIEVTLAWADDGQLRGVVHEQLRGALASSIRAFLRGNGGDHHQLVQQLAAGAFPGAALQLLNIDGLAGEGAIALAYEVTLAADAARADALELDLWAEQLGQAYAQLPTRTTPLLFSHTLDQTLTIRVLDAGAVAELPLDVLVARDALRYHRQVRRDGAALVLTRSLWSRPAVIAPADYGAFAQAVRAIDAADHVRLHRSP